MDRTKRGSLEFKYMVSIAGFIIVGIILWSFIFSLYKSMNIFSWISISILFVVGLAFSFWIVLRRLVIIPVQSIEKAVRTLAEGDFSFKVPDETNDELGRLTGILKKSINSLGTMLFGIKKSSRQTTEVSERVSGEFKKIAETTKLESEAISNIASSIEEMNSATAEISVNSGGLAVSAENTVTSM